MNPFFKLSAVLAFIAGAGSLAAQTAPADPQTPPLETDDEVVQLSPFLVSGSGQSVGRYTSLESTSAGRVRVNIMDSTQNVSVITSEMITDVGAGRILDATKYIAGISESTLPNANERTNVRGFQADGRTVDGFTYGGFMNMDPAIVDRIEVVKGPSPILAPQPTSPGGTINNATKKPQFRDFGAINAQVGEFDANSASIDLNRKVNNKLAMRFVGSVRDWDNWWQDSYIESYTWMPGITYKFSDTAQLTLQYIYSQWESSLYLGLPVDPSAGTTNKAYIIAGVPKDLSVYAPDIYRTDQQHDWKLLFTAELFGGIQMRLSALYHKTSQYAPQLNTGNSTTGTGGNRDPLTGNYVPGMQYLGVAPFTGSPIAVGPSRIFVRSGTDPRNDPRTLFVQNDYVYIANTEKFDSTTLVGFAFTESHDYGSSAYNISAPNFNIDNYTDVAWTRGTLNFQNHTSNRFMQGYVSETLELFDNRLILNGAFSKNYYRQRARSQITNIFHGVGPEAELPSYGVTIKPYKDVLSVYYSYSEQSTSNGPSINGPTNTVPPLTSSEQTEYGVRTKLSDKLYFTVSHFDIKQDNFSVPNPANLTTPPPSPLLPALFSDRKAKGWEYELRANPTPNLSIIGNYTHFKNRDPNGVEFRGVAEKSAAVLVSYTFDKETRFEGFRVAFGADYIGNRPGDAPSGVTAASTPTNVIPNQPTFYLGSRTLATAIFSYNSKHNWGVQLNIDNVFDVYYHMASINRSMVYTGTPRNFRLSANYKF
jgi:iron complex outermembrane recepter protein